MILYKTTASDLTDEESKENSPIGYPQSESIILVLHKGQAVVHEVVVHLRPYRFLFFRGFNSVGLEGNERGSA